MWLGEQITERGIGNGISMLIFRWYRCRYPRRHRSGIRVSSQGDLNPLLDSSVDDRVAVVYFVVFIERGSVVLRLTMHSATGRQAYQRTDCHCRLKLIWRVLYQQFSPVACCCSPPRSAMVWSGVTRPAWLQDIALLIGPGQPLYILLFSALDYILQLLLYGVDVQPERSGR